jgi:hypothetical protein
LTARAYVQDHFPGGIGIYLGRLGDNLRTQMVFTEQRSEIISEAVSRPPSFTLDEDEARALLDALAQHFGGTAEVQTLRRDYLDERGRVDRLINHLIGGGNAN